MLDLTAFDRHARQTISQRNDQYYTDRQHLDSLGDDFKPSERLERIARYAEPTPENILAWGKCYMGKAVGDDYGHHHTTITQCLQVRGSLVVLILPRGYGKTTMTKVYLAYCIAYGLEPHIVYLEHDADTASTQANDIVKLFTTEPKILADYGRLQGDLWQASKGSLTFRHTTPHPYVRHRYIMVRFASLRSMVRGTTFDFSRITCAIINDPTKDSTEASSSTYVKKALKIIKEDIGLAGAATKHNPMSLIVIGTKMSDDDVMTKLEDDPMSTVYKEYALDGDHSLIQAFVQAVSEDIPNIHAFKTEVEGTPPTLTGKHITAEDQHYYCTVSRKDYYAPFFEALDSTWADMYPLPEYVFRIARYGSDVFMQEMMHSPADAFFRKYFREWFVPYSTDTLTVDLRYGITIDLADGPKDGTDPLVVFGGAYDAEQDHIFPVSVWCDQGTPTDVVYRTYACYHQLRQYCPKIMTDDGLESLDSQIPVWLESQIGGNGVADLFTQIRDKERLLGGAGTYPDGTPRPEVYRDPSYWESLDVLLARQTDNKIVRLNEYRVTAEQRKIHQIPGDPGHELMIQQFTNYKGKPTHTEPDITKKVDIPDMIELFTRKMRGFSRELVWVN